VLSAPYPKQWDAISHHIQRWAPALFSRFCAFALASAKPKKEREIAKKKEREKKRKRRARKKKIAN
jgi:hypothetical protein